ncbi:TolC family protein [Tropicibacter naphthalenivorans]|uniref:Type I secretion outer membrane protein, TolC family n=1 Tax=Tropicibacter naphthalenivorans TaxID=441103 RepID=A0A0N7LZW2_9RHOB|nr:TolC family protein [Tropicibacter naphthalenivorans]CUH78777.1 type I secretion outer membrane protein, TolC family [Tropicibacter naphthalenivorans]SMC81483.1 outer membrane protein, adhesin transport system [Tropicibacter naphthalenivorans]
MSKSRRSLGLIAILAMLPGCMKDMGDGVVSRFKGAEPTATAPADPKLQKAVAKPSDASEIIHALQTRPSVILSGTPYSRVADAVIASDSRVAEAELRVAQLRAEAAQSNWMPRIGPRISLNSLGDFVAELVINQVLFDNGRKKAERDLAKANVEIAAVTLVEDGNERVYDALSLYIRAEENRDLSAHLNSALKEMAHFEWVMQERVNGGVSDMSDLNVLRQKLSSMRARSGEAQEATTTAMAELNAMSARKLDELRGIGGLKETSAGEPLGVIRASAKREQAIAEAKIARASNLPGLAANGAVGAGGLSGGLEVTTDSLFSLGTMAEFEAIEATKESATRRVAEAREVAERQVQAQSNRLVAFRRQAAEASTLTAQAKQNLDLFRAQYEGGQRQVMDVVGVYETYAAALETEIQLKYKAARAELELARLRGALAEGARI